MHCVIKYLKEHKEMNKYVCGAIAIVAITVMECFAINKGIDGTLFKVGIGAIFGIAAGLGGYAIGKITKGSDK